LDIYLLVHPIFIIFAIQIKLFLSHSFMEILCGVQELQLIKFKEFPQLLLQECMEIESQWFLDQRVAPLQSHLQF